MTAANRVFGVAMAAMFLVGAAACDKKEGLRVTGIEPKSGPYSGGGVVSIHGSGFQEDGAKGVKVYFGSREARVLGWVGDSTLKVETPPVEADEIGKPVDILLVFDDARDLTIEKAYTFEDAHKGFGVDALVEGEEGVQATPPNPDQPATDQQPAAQ